MRLVPVNSPEKSYRILSCSISGDHKTEKAIIMTEYELDEDFDSYSIFDEELEIFIGKIISGNGSQYELCNKTEEIQSGIIKRIVNDLLLQYSSKDKSKYPIKADKLFYCDFKYFKRRAIKVNMNILWKNYKPEIWDVGKDIFQDMKTVTAKSIINSWPKVDSNMSGWKVMESNVTEKTKSWIKAHGKYLEMSHLDGSLLISRVAEVLNHERWSFLFAQAEEYEEKDLFLDLSNYSMEHSEWKANFFYEKGSLVTFDSGEGKTLKTCIEDHDSGLDFDKKMWKDESDYYSCNEEVLFKSHFGRDLLTVLLRNLYLDLLSNKPEMIVEATGTWEYWRNVKIGTIVEFEKEGQKVRLEVTKFNKKANQEVTIECRRLGNNLESSMACDYWDSFLRFASPVEIKFNEGKVIQEVQIKNNLEEQLKDKTFRSTLIELSSNPFYINSAVLVIRCLEREDGSYNEFR